MILDILKKPECASTHKGNSSILLKVSILPKKVYMFCFILLYQIESYFFKGEKKMKREKFCFFSYSSTRAPPRGLERRGKA